MHQILAVTALLSLLASPVQAEPIENAVLLALGLNLPTGSALAGQVVDREGRPVAGAAVHAYAKDPDRMGRITSAEARAGADGAFRFPGLVPETTYRLSVYAEGFVYARREAVPGPRVRIVLDRGITFTGRIVDGEGQPVAGADLVLWTTADEPKRSGSSTSLKLQASSDARGRFRFEHVGTGIYQIGIRRRGFAPAWREGVADTGLQGTFDIGDLPLEPGAVIEGVVTDLRGTPVAGAQVRTDGSERPPFPQRYQFDKDPEPLLTGPDGQFRIGDLENGRSFSLRISHSGYVPASAPGIEAPTPEPLRIELRPAQSLNLRVLDPERRPVAGARISRVEIQETGIRDSSSAAWSASGLGETDEEGRAVLSEIEPGELRLLVQAQGYRPTELPGLHIPEEEEPEPIEVLLEPGAVLEGRVLDSRGEPMAQVRLNAFPPDVGRPGPMISALTEEDGRYRFDGLGSGEHRVEAEHWPSQRRAAGKIVLADSGTHRLDLRLPAGVAVSGRVLDENGEPLPGAWVTLTRDGPPEPGLPASSAAGGRFRFEAVPDGVYRLQAGTRDHLLMTEPDEVSVAGREIEGLLVRLGRGATITGRILGIAEKDLRNVRLVARPEGGGEAVRGGFVALGVYSFPPLIPGAWEVTAMLTSGLAATGTTRVSAGEEAVLDLEIPRGLTLSGRVLLNGQPLPEARVTGFLPASAEGETGEGPGTMTRHDGSFELRGLRPGRLTLAVFARGVFQSESLDLTADREITIEILTGRLSGHVLSSTGEPVVGATVALRGEDARSGIWSQATQASTDETGAFEVPRLAAGSYRITVTREGFGPAEQTVTVTPGGAAEVQVVLEAEAGGD